MRWMLLSMFVVSCGDDDAVIADAPKAIDAAVDAPSCNTLAQTATQVIQQRVAEVAPTPTGGTVPDGKYHLTTDTIYTGVGGMTGPTGYTSTLTSSCVAPVCEIVIAETNGLVPRQTFTVVVNGTAISLDQTCPTTGSLTGTISTTIAGTTTVALGEAAGIYTRVRVYQLQP